MIFGIALSVGPSVLFDFFARVLGAVVSLGCILSFLGVQRGLGLLGLIFKRGGAHRRGGFGHVPGVQRFGLVGRFGVGPQKQAAFHDARVDTGLDRLLGDPVQHLGIRGRRFRPEEAVTRCEVSEILRDGLHGLERIVEPFEGT